MSMPVLDEETGKSLEYRQLHHHPRYKDTWNQSYSNELGRLYQGVCTESTGTGQPVAGTNKFFVT